MPRGLTDANIEELSLVFAEKDGQLWAPRNRHARVLAVKGAPSFLDRFASMLGMKKAEPETDIVAQAFAQTYAAKALAVRELFDNMQAAHAMTDPDAREAALRAALDSHFDGFETKAGARHSKSDSEKIAAIGDNLAKLQKSHDKMGKSIAAARDAHAGLSPSADAAEDAADGGSDEASEKADKKPYGDVAYADEKNGKYPIDTAEHARAAWDYINKEKNAAEYSSDELAAVKSKIRAACAKFGIELSDKAAPQDDAAVDVIPEAAEAVADAVEPEEQPADAILEEPPAVEEAKAEPVDFAAILKAALAEQSAALDAKIAATLDPLTAQLAEKSQQVSALEASIKAQAIAKAQERTSPGGNPSFNGAGFGQPAILGDVTLEPAPIDPKTSTVRDVIRNRKTAA